MQKNLKNSIILLAVVIIATYISYLPAKTNPLVSWDDKAYIADNVSLQNLDKNYVKKSFSFPEGVYRGNYHPITMLSYAWEYSKAKLNPAPYHIHNILLHLLNVILVFVFALKLTNKSVTALILSATFAFHPMHVESVAWVAERKDLLYVFFSLICLICYIIYIENQNKILYAIAILLFICALLSKAMAVSVVLVMFLVDYYLDRKIDFKKQLFEKLPIILIAVIFGILAIIAQKQSGFIQFQHYTLYDRILFAFYAFCVYLFKAFIPINLSTYYDYPANGQYNYFIIYILLVLIIIWVVYKYHRSNKSIMFSFLFFAFAIAQILQLLPVGGAIIAERYTYFAYIGLFVAPSVWLGNQIENNKKYKYILLIGFIGGCIFLCNKTYKRCLVWKNDISIWSDALEKEPNLIIGLGARGEGYSQEGKYDSAYIDLNKAIGIKPDYLDAIYNRGIVEFHFGKQKQDLGKTEEARSFYLKAIEDNKRAISLNPKLSKAYYNLSGNYFYLGDYINSLDAVIKAKELGENIDTVFVKVIKNNIVITHQTRK